MLQQVFPQHFRNTMTTMAADWWWSIGCTGGSSVNHLHGHHYHHHCPCCQVPVAAGNHHPCPGYHHSGRWFGCHQILPADPHSHSVGCHCRCSHPAGCHRSHWSGCLHSRHLQKWTEHLLYFRKQSTEFRTWINTFSPDDLRRTMDNSHFPSCHYQRGRKTTMHCTLWLSHQSLVNKNNVAVQPLMGTNHHTPK